MHKIRRDLVSKLVKYQIGNDGRQHAAYASERGTQSDRGTSGTSGKQLCRVREDHIEIAGCEELADQRAQHLIDVRICVRTHSPVSITHKQKNIVPVQENQPLGTKPVAKQAKPQMKRPPQSVARRPAFPIM